MKSMFPLMYGNALKHRQRRCVKNVHRPFFLSEVRAASLGKFGLCKVNMKD